jgi:hypothetical protein
MSPPLHVRPSTSLRRECSRMLRTNERTTVRGNAELVDASNHEPSGMKPILVMASAAKQSRHKKLLHHLCSIGHARAAIAEELDELSPTDDDGSRHEAIFIELASFEAGGADVDLATRLGEIFHQLC